MLRGLDIRDILIIDRLELEFQSGLNVLTGETGAGKSILLDSLGFVLGWRGRAELVRQGAKQGEVTAIFDLPNGHPARKPLDEAGIALDDGELILRRLNTVEGRKTAWINDRRVSGEVLRNVSAHLVELHGQHDDRGLLNPRGHRTLLDAFGGLDKHLKETRALWRAAQAADTALAEAQDRVAALAADEEFLRHAVAELEALSPQPGEEEELDTRRRTMQAAERVREDIGRAQAALSNEGAEGLLGDASRWLDGAAEAVDGHLDAPIEALARAMDALGEAEQGVAACLDALSFDPRDLEETEERLFALRALARKHGVLADALAGLTVDLRGRLDTLDTGSADIARLQSEAQIARDAHDRACAALTRARTDAAVRLDTAVTAELAPLKMERAVFETRIGATEPGPEGADQVSFTVATNPGAPAGPLDRIASGGELSRFLLALKVCLRGDDGRATMIFDEIDRGVGGATADAVGRRLMTLAEGAQVLVVTHSPQVAAFGAHHWRVEKRVVDELTLSTVVPLHSTDRVDELARMLSGDSITDAARAAARALLQV